MSRCPANNFQLSIMSKWLAKHISTNVSFKFTIRKRHVYVDIGWPWTWNQCFYLWIRNDDRTKMIVLTSFQFTKWLNLQSTNIKCLSMNFVTLICVSLLVFPIGIIEVSTLRKCCFLLYFCFLHDYWPPSTWNPLVNASWGEIEQFENGAFQLLKMRKKISWNK